MLGALRARVDEEPLLVVPAFEDVEHNQRELAERGAVFGVHVVRFKRLFAQIAWRAGVRGRAASRLQRELIVADAVRAAGLEVLAESAERPGFVRAATRFVAEVERSLAERSAAGPAMVGPARLTQALRAWAGEGPRRGYVDEIARDLPPLPRAPRRRRPRRRRAARLAGGQRATREPASWGETPVFVYGFDDFTPLELAALAALAGSPGVDVTVSLPWEAGREAFRATARLRGAERGRPALSSTRCARRCTGRADVRPLPRARSRPALRAGSPAPRRCIRRSSAGRDRAMSTPLRAGPIPAEMSPRSTQRRRATPSGCTSPAAGAPRSSCARPRSSSCCAPAPSPATSRSCCATRGPTPRRSSRSSAPTASRTRSTAALPLRHTGVGRGLLALLRCAAGTGLPTTCSPTCAPPAGCASRSTPTGSRSRCAATATGSARRARELWDGWAERDGIGPFPLDEIDRLAAAADDPEALLDELAKHAGRLFSGPYRRTAHVLEGPSSTTPVPSRRSAARCATCARSSGPARGSTSIASRRPSPRSRSTPARIPSRAASQSLRRRRSVPAASTPSSSAACRRASSRRAAAPTRSSPTATGARSPPQAGSRCRCARTSSSASGTSSTSAPHAPSASSSSAHASAARRAGPSSRRSSSTTSSESFRGCARRRGGARSPTSPGPRTTRRPPPSGSEP